MYSFISQVFSDRLCGHVVGNGFANHNVLFEKGFIDIDVLVKCIIGYFRSNSTVGLSSSMIGKIMEFSETMPPDKIPGLQSSLQTLIQASGTDNRIGEFLTERQQEDTNLPFIYGSLAVL